jgi:hypothetical protein
MALGIKGWVKKFGNENAVGKLLGVKLSFNYLSGSNIRLAYKVQRLEVVKITNDLDKYFKQYFHAIAPTKISTTAGNGIFMPMPPYTIKYGLYQMPQLLSPDISDVETALSNCIIDALSDTEVDADSLLTLGFYLHVALINEYLQFFSRQGAIDTLHAVSGSIDGGYSDPQYHENYLECESLLKEIFDQLRYISPNVAPGWILSWSAACKAALGKSDLIGMKIFLNGLRNIIDDQLGLDRKLKDLLNYFIKQTYRSES